ncbi:AzlD family protein [Halopiger goleimassiliensis]|uniref:AzlD family protein n=1 Tax=Halopiger goleimassiliensis TaxID=1293048 RepID=UPI000677DE8E|nr:AzlD domain-containing protein [Halopiger goleimassiliensis]
MTDGALTLEWPVVATILGMALVTYATKAGGLWLIGRIDGSLRLERALEILPGVLVVSILAAEVLEGGPPEWTSAAVVAVVVWRTERLVLGLLAGVLTVLVLRGTL